MFLDTQPASLDGSGGSDPWSEFRVDHPREVQLLMRQLRDGAVPVNLNAPDGSHLTTTLWAVDEGTRTLNFLVDVDPARVEALVRGSEIVAVSYLESVKLQFDLHHAVLVRSPSGCALRAAWPDVVYRFQRRRGYRVRTLDRTRPTAFMRHPSLPDMTVTLRVVDVSIGGCCLLMADDVPPLQAGTRIAGVRVELDADTHFEAWVELQHVTAISQQEGAVRLGCEWADLQGAAERSLQRYIDQTQKRHRLLDLR